MSSTIARKTGSATLVVDNFSQQTESDEVEFNIQGYSSIFFGIRPNVVIGERPYAFIYLQNFCDTFKFRANVFILNSEGVKLITREYFGEFCDENDEMEYSLMPCWDLLSPDYGYLDNDKLTLLCEVEVTEDKQEDQKITDTIRNDFTSLSENYQSLLSDGKFSDATLLVGTDAKKFRVHKAILSARSPVFAAMFEHDCEEKRQNKVTITDMDEDVCGRMLYYIYTGQVKELDRFAMELLVAADKYQLDSLKTFCAQYLSSHLAIESAANVLVLSDMHRASELKTKCLDYIWNNVTKVKATNGWKMLCSSRPLLLEELLDYLANKYNK